MNRISSVPGGSQLTGWEMVLQAGGNVRPAGEIAAKGDGKTGYNRKTASEAILKDTVLLSETDTDWNDRVQSVLESLRKQYSSLNIIIDNGSRDGNIAGSAADLGTGKHLVISRDFLTRMGSSAREFSKCSSILSGIAMKVDRLGSGLAANSAITAAGAYVEESGTSFWTAENNPAVPDVGSLVSGLSKPADKDTGTSADKDEMFCKRKSKVPSLSVSRNYSRLAGARTKGQVQAVMADVQRVMGNLRQIAVSGENEERVKANRALRSLNKLLSRGSRKISRISREQLISMRSKRAQKQQEELKAEQAGQERKRLQIGRMGSDYALVREGKADGAYIRGYRYYRRTAGSYGDTEKNIYPADIGSVGISSAGTGDAGEMSGMAGIGGGEITAVDVTVFGEISF